MRDQAPFPFFTATELRPLTGMERAVVTKLLEGTPERYRTQAEGLRVVGRCGCGACPIIFFEHHAEGDREVDLVSYSGQDSFGGLVAAVLMQKEGRLSQLDFFSIDGHEPWGVPDVATLQPYE